MAPMERQTTRVVATLSTKYLILHVYPYTFAFHFPIKSLLLEQKTYVQASISYSYWRRRRA